MAFRIQQVSDYGASNPICARLTLQINELLKFCKISEKQKENVFGVMLLNVVPKLMVCFRIKEQLTKEIRAHQKKIDDKGSLNFRHKVVPIPFLQSLIYNIKQRLFFTMPNLHCEILQPSF
jgi:hypothetical protein